jgi:Na+/glutamate symporter
VAAHLTGIHSAIKMLNSRVRVLHQYLVAMQRGVSWLLIFILFFVIYTMDATFNLNDPLISLFYACLLSEDNLSRPNFWTNVTFVFYIIMNLFQVMMLLIKLIIDGNANHLMKWSSYLLAVLF